MHWKQSCVVYVCVCKCMSVYFNNDLECELLVDLVYELVYPKSASLTIKIIVETQNNLILNYST